MVQEHHLDVKDLIWPVFVVEGSDIAQDIESLPGVSRYSIDRLCVEVKKAADLGIPAIALFPAIEAKKKSEDAREAYNPDNLICRAIAALKHAVPHMGIITDVALDPYSAHGHDGLMREGRVVNDETVEALCKQALAQAKAGADIIAPSDMMDGRVSAIRSALDSSASQDTMIMSYTAKYASHFYDPFRDAVKSGDALKGHKKTYQMNSANADEALSEAEQDIAEGADMIMVKPGLAYLDIIHTLKTSFKMPTFAYHVSGEYAMLQAAAQNGWLSYDDCLLEVLLSFKRAGCDGILTYGARDAAALIKS